MLKRLYAVTASVLIFAVTGCFTQTTLAALTLTLGNTAAAVATIENNPALSAKLTKDTQVAVTAIQQWKPGTSAQSAIQAIELVSADLSLFPVTGQYAALIQLALATTVSIIQILDPGAVTAMSAHTATASAPVKAPQTAKDFHRACAQIAANSNFNASVCK